MLRKYQSITIFAFFTCMLSLCVACSNDDVPVGDEEMEIPGASMRSKLVGNWVCGETENQSLIPIGFYFTVMENMQVIPNGNSPLIRSGVVQGGRSVTFGDGPVLTINELTDVKLLLAYTSDTTYNFSFVRSR